MHGFIVNASIQVLPVVQDRHPYEWVDEAIAVIKKSKIQYEIGPFATVIEGDYNDVMQVVNDINNYLLEKGCSEWITSVQLQIRNNGDITSLEKTAKFKQ